jgi:hypothetical protein
METPGRSDGGRPDPPTPRLGAGVRALPVLVVILSGFLLVLFVLPGGRDDDPVEAASTTLPEVPPITEAASTTTVTPTVATTTPAATTAPEPGPDWQWETVTGGGELPGHVTGRLGDEFVTLDGGDDGALWRSPDGLEWEREPGPALGGRSPSYGLVAGSTLWVRTDSDDFVSGAWWTTTDARSWAEAVFDFDVEGTNVIVSPGLSWGAWGFAPTSDAGARSGDSIVVPGYLDLLLDAEAVFGAGARLEWEWDTFEPAEYRVMVGGEAVEEVYLVRSVDGPTVTLTAFRLPADGADPDPARDTPLGRASVVYAGAPEGWAGGDGFLPADFESLQGLWVSDDGGGTFRFLAMPETLGNPVSPTDVVVFDDRFFTLLLEGFERTTTSVGESVTATADASVYRVASSAGGWDWEPGPFLTLDADVAPRLLVLGDSLLLGTVDGWLLSQDGEQWEPLPLPGTTGVEAVQAAGGGLVGFGIEGRSGFAFTADLEHWATIPNPPGINPSMCEAFVVDGAPMWVAPGIRQIWVAHPAGEAEAETGSAATD